VAESLPLLYGLRVHVMSAFSFTVVTILMFGIDMIAFEGMVRSMLG
jgi:hypothetical protein